MFDIFVGDHISCFRFVAIVFVCCLVCMNFLLLLVAASLQSVKHSEAFNRQMSQMGAQKDIMGIEQMPTRNMESLLFNTFFF